MRAGSRTSEQPRGVNTGYFIVIPEGDRASKKEQEAWQIETHMEVSGQATDHEALSSFVRRVLQQPQIGDVRILNTQQQVSVDRTVVDFRLEVLRSLNQMATKSMTRWMCSRFTVSAAFSARC